MSRCHKRMQVIGHHYCSKNPPVLKLANGCFQCVEGSIVRQDALPVRNAHRHEINDALFPRQPNRYSRWTAHARSLAGGAPALQFLFIAGIICRASASLAAERGNPERSGSAYNFPASRYTSVAAAISSTAIPSDLKTVVSFARDGTLPASASPSSA
jgi:hypothetical protein